MLLPTTINFLKKYKFKSANSTDDNGNPAIIYAIDSNNEEVVTDLILAGVDILFIAGETSQEYRLRDRIRNIRSFVMPKLEEGYTLMHAAVLQPPGILGKLLIAGGNKLINQGAGTHNTTVLHMAVRLGNIDHVHTLIEHKADPNISCRGEMPLHIAVKLDRIDIIEALLASEEIDVNVQNSSNSTTALLLAVELGCEEVVETLLIKRDIDIDLPDKYGQIPLLVAAGNNYSGMIKLLLEHIADKSEYMELPVTSKVIDLICNQEVFNSVMKFPVTSKRRSNEEVFERVRAPLRLAVEEFAITMARRIKDKSVTEKKGELYIKQEIRQYLEDILSSMASKSKETDKFIIQTVTRTLQHIMPEIIQSVNYKNRSLISNDEYSIDNEDDEVTLGGNISVSKCR